jgi:hypothetical protein
MNRIQMAKKAQQLGLLIGVKVGRHYFPMTVRIAFTSLAADPTTARDSLLQSSCSYCGRSIPHYRRDATPAGNPLASMRGPYWSLKCSYCSEVFTIARSIDRCCGHSPAGRFDTGPSVPRSLDGVRHSHFARRGESSVGPSAEAPRPRVARHPPMRMLGGGVGRAFRACLGEARSGALMAPGGSWLACGRQLRSKAAMGIDGA